MSETEICTTEGPHDAHGDCGGYPHPSPDEAYLSLREEMRALADEMCAFNIEEHPVPASVDVPDDYESGVHECGRRLRAAIERVTT
jgi:hypothetical protein